MRKKNKKNKPRRETSGYRVIENMIDYIFDDWRRNWNWVRENPVNGW